MLSVVYKITRSDNLEYIGVTVNLKSRLYSHKKSVRFSIGIKNVEILYEGEYSECLVRESQFIEYYNTYTCGLNVTPTGQGKNKECKFNTFGYKFSDESRQKMSDAKRKQIVDGRFKSNFNNRGKKHTPEHKKWLSEINSGENNKNSKVTEKDVRYIREMYKIKPFLDVAGKKSKNGKLMSYDRAFCLMISEKFKIITPECVDRIIKNRIWRNVSV